MSKNLPLLTHPAAKFLIRHCVELLTILALLFVLQTSLVPFDFLGDQPITGSDELFTSKADHLTFPDTVFNIFLYVPVGLLLHCWLCRVCGNRTLALLLAIATAAVLSGTVEWIQAYAPARVSSIIDFVANIVGASVGALISYVARWILPRLVGTALYEFHTLPQTALVKTYCLALVVAAVMPFSLSFDSFRIKQSLKNARLVPFAVVAECETAAEEALAAGDYWHYSQARWHSLKRWSRWMAECAAFALLVWLIEPVLRGQYGFSARATCALLWWLCGALAICLSLLQLPILTRGFDATDIVFRLLGVGVGLVTRSVYLRTKDRLGSDNLTRYWHSLARAGCAAMFVYIVYTGLIPLTFNLGHGGPAASIASESFLPFFAYFVTRFDLMMDDVMEKFVSYALFAALLVTCWARAGRVATSSRVFVVAAVGVAISVVIEIAQMFIPVRVTSLTDPILAAAGCAVGVLGQEYAVSFYRFASTHEMLGPAEAEPRPTMVGDLAPADALIASLAEPRQDAPVEPSPKPRPTRPR